MNRGTLTLVHLTHLAHDARTAGSRAVQTAAVLISIACVLLADSVRIAIAERLLLELLLLLPMAVVLCYALGVVRMPDVRIAVSLRELVEMPAVLETLHLADSRLQRARRDLRTLAMHACVLLDSYVWSRAALPTPLGVRIEHLNAMFSLVDAWLRNRSLSGVIDALAAHLLCVIDARPLRRLIDQLRAAITLRRIRAAGTTTQIIATDAVARAGARRRAAPLNLRC
jgi:hypothetical protein